MRWTDKTPIHPNEVVGFVALAAVIAVLRLVSLYRLWVPDIANEDAFTLSPWGLTLVLLGYGFALLSMHSMSRVLRVTLVAMMLAYGAYFGGILIRNAWAIRNARTSFSWLEPYRALTSRHDTGNQAQIRRTSTRSQCFMPPPAPTGGGDASRWSRNLDLSLPFLYAEKIVQGT